VSCPDSDKSCVRTATTPRSAGGYGRASLQNVLKWA
jgi:hypothetical protein